MKHRFFSLLGIVAGLKHSERRAFTCRNGQYQIRKSSYSDVCNVNIDEVGRFYLFNSNGIPDHDTAKAGPTIKAQNIKLAIPKNPITLEEPECVGQGIVGVALNGVPIFNAKSSDCCDNAIKNLKDNDQCNGYTSPNGIYRYHIYPICLQQCVFRSKSGILGVALDGFPIYGPVDDDGAQLTTRDLDECHGKWHGSEYRYHVTADYPYFINCFRGRVPAQNKQTPVRRRGRRSYSWREGARLPEFEETFQLPLKMGDCKVCASVNSCFGNSRGMMNSYQSHSHWSQTGSSYSNSEPSSPYRTKTPITARLEPRKKPMTRTLSNASYYTPPKATNQHNQAYNSNVAGIHSQITSNNVPSVSSPSSSQGNLQVQRNKKSLFSLYRPQTTTRPFLWTTVQPTAKPKMALPRNAFNSAPPAQSHAVTNKPRSTINPGNSKLNNTFRPQSLPNRSTQTTKPATSLKGMFKNIIRLKNSNVATPQEAEEHILSKATSARQLQHAPATTSDEIDLNSILESLRTGPSMRWKSAAKGPPVLTPAELRQMLEDTHVSKVAKLARVDPLITLLEDDTRDTKIKITKKSGGTPMANGQYLDESKIRDATSVHTKSHHTTNLPETKREKIKNMWGNLNPSAGRFRSANPNHAAATTTTAETIKTTKITPRPTVPSWYKFTSTVKPWVRSISQRISSPTNNNKGLSEYIMVNGVRRRIPDNVRHMLDGQRNKAVPENMLREAARETAIVQRRNSYLKSAFGRRRRSTSELDIMEALREVRRSQGKYSKKHEVGFLMRKDGLTIIKCEAPSFKTPSPAHINPKHLSPKLLELMLRERKDVVRVKQSAFSRLFNN